MEIFHSYSSEGSLVLLDAEESAHCVRVLRHRKGDEITVVDGLGTMFRCRLTDDSPKGRRLPSSKPFPAGAGIHIH